MVELEKLITELKPALMMVVVQVVYSGTNVLYKLAAADGMSLWVLVAFRYIFAAAIMLPLAYVLERLDTQSNFSLHMSFLLPFPPNKHSFSLEKFIFFN